MLDFEGIYSELAKANASQQKKLDVSSTLDVFYGISEEGYYRISFVSKTQAPSLESTKLLRVVQGMEKDGIYWTCFDLLNLEIKKVFFTFCSNLVEAIEFSSSEAEALDRLKKRYMAWKSMFRNGIKGSIPKEIIQGLYGELLFLKKYMEPKYGIDYAVQAWSGPEGTSKDFSIETTWYEVKTVGINSQTAKINSLAQLSSDDVGHLVVVKAESMSKEYSDGESCIAELVATILNDIHNPIVENDFLIKLGSFGVDITDECFLEKFKVKQDGIKMYSVDNHFPRITERNITFSEIVSAVYELSLSAIEKYREE